MLRDCYLWEHVLTSPMRGMPIHATSGDGIEITRHVFAACDASDRALGGVIDGQERGLYMPMTDEERDESSMVRELAGIDVILAAFETNDGETDGKGLPPGSVIFLRTDSLCSDYVLKRGGSGNVYGDALVAMIYLRCLRRGWRLETQWVPRDDNTIADDRSKDIDHGDYCISKRALKQVCRELRVVPSFDIFSALWARIDEDIPYCSRWFMPGSSGDAWHRSWCTASVGDAAWLFAPPSQLNDAFHKMQRDKFKGVIVVPCSSEAWWRTKLDEWRAGDRFGDRIKGAGIRMTAENGGIVQRRSDEQQPPRGAFEAFLIDLTL